MTTERDSALAQMALLLHHARWAALATSEDDGSPYASAVAFAPAPDFSCFLLHLSGLAPHTRNLVQHPAVSLLISEPDLGAGDPQTLARLSILGRAVPVARDSDGYEAARQIYLARIPSAAELFSFADFQLFRLEPREVRFVGGFARARRFDPQALAEAARFDRT